jgi:hypothetical protein
MRETGRHPGSRSASRFHRPAVSALASSTAGPHGGEFAVFGGTGRFAGARGTYTAREHEAELGEGTAEFRIALMV